MKEYYLELALGFLLVGFLFNIVSFILTVLYKFSK